MKMNRSDLCAGLVVLGVIVLIFVWFMSGVRCSFAAGSPKQLPPVSEEVAGKIEAAVPATATAKPAKARKILVFWLCKGYFHDCIPVANKVIEVMSRKTGAFEAVFSDDMNEFTAEKLAGFDAVLFNNTTKLEFNEPAQRQALMDFVKGGKGIIGIHAATDNFYNWPEGAEMMGGLFAGHPWTAEGTWAIKNVEPNHPLNAAFKGEGFKINDEIYRVRPLKPMENRRVLLALDLDDPATKMQRASEKATAISRSVG